jgi:hypothetical protein
MNMANIDGSQFIAHGKRNICVQHSEIFIYFMQKYSRAGKRKKLITVIPMMAHSVFAISLC